MGTELERAIARFRRPPVDGAEARISAAAFRASVQQRLRSLERDVSDVKNRVNGLIFVVLGAVVTQVVLRVMG